MKLDKIKGLIKKIIGRKNWYRAGLVYDCLFSLARTFDNKTSDKGFPVPVEEIRAALVCLGIGKGDRLVMHSSAKNLFEAAREDTGLSQTNIVNYSRDIIEMLLDLIGPEGTLMMNTDSISNLKAFALDGEVFDYRKDYSRRGWISEMFRRRPDVCRSVHPFYNVTAWGKDAAEMMESHEKSTPFTMDENSPWFRMTCIGGKTVLLGATFEQNSLLHLPEYTHAAVFPRPIFYHLPFNFKYINRQGKEKVMPSMVQVNDYVEGMPTCFSLYLQSKYNLFKIKELHRTQITAYDCAEFYRAMVKEIEAGVCWYDSRFRPRGEA
ncbi:AAC(3) family N-acetyltransferase [bacterium]|nr:AAC(3) family N-acetyltransferase [bacterium]